MEKKREFENANPQETIISSRAPCIICFQPRNALYVLNPCGHTSLCEFCAIKLTEERYAKCPTCRKPVRNYIKLFFQVPEEEHPREKEKLQSLNDVAVDIDLKHKFSCIVNKTCEQTLKAGDHQYDKYLNKTDPIWWRTHAPEEGANQEEDCQVNEMDH